LRQALDIGRAYLRHPTDTFFAERALCLHDWYNQQGLHWSGPVRDAEGIPMPWHRQRELWQAFQIESRLLLEVEGRLRSSRLWVQPPLQERPPVTYSSADSGCITAMDYAYNRTVHPLVEVGADIAGEVDTQGEVFTRDIGAGANAVFQPVEQGLCSTIGTEGMDVVGRVGYGIDATIFRPIRFLSEHV